MNDKDLLRLLRNISEQISSLGAKQQIQNRRMVELLKSIEIGINILKGERKAIKAAPPQKEVSKCLPEPFLLPETQWDVFHCVAPKSRIHTET